MVLDVLKYPKEPYDARSYGVMIRNISTTAIGEGKVGTGVVVINNIKMRKQCGKT